MADSKALVVGVCSCGLSGVGFGIYLWRQKIERNAKMKAIQIFTHLNIQHSPRRHHSPVPEETDQLIITSAPHRDSQPANRGL
jgi:hypothetical protein